MRFVFWTGCAGGLAPRFDFGAQDWAYIELVDCQIEFEHGGLRVFVIAELALERASGELPPDLGFGFEWREFSCEMPFKADGEWSRFEPGMGEFELCFEWRELESPA